MTVPGFRFLVAVAITLMAKPILADDACPKFVGTKAYDEATAKIKRSEFGTVEDTLVPVFAGKVCTPTEIAEVMMELGFKVVKPNPVLAGRKGTWRGNGQSGEFDYELGFCYPTSFPRSLFMNCWGSAVVFFLNERVSYIQVNASI